MAKENLASGFTATLTGDIAHYPLQTNMGVVYCPVKLKLDAKGKVIIPHKGRGDKRLPMPVVHGDQLVFVAPGGKEIFAEGPMMKHYIPEV